MYVGVQHSIPYVLDASVFVDGLRNKMILVKTSSKSERTIHLIECCKQKISSKTYKISKHPTPHFLYPNSDYGLVALWCDDGMLNIYKMKSNILAVSLKIGEDGSVLRTLRFVGRDLILLILENSTILILQMEEKSQTPSVYLNFRLASTILSEAAYFFQKSSLLIVVNHQFYLEAYQVFPQFKTAWLLVKELFSNWYPLDRPYKLTPHYINQSELYLCFHSDANETPEKRTTFVNVDELMNGKFVETVVGPFENGGRVAMIAHNLLSFSQFYSCNIMRIHTSLGGIEISPLKKFVPDQMKSWSVLFPLLKKWQMRDKVFRNPLYDHWRSIQRVNITEFRILGWRVYGTRSIYRPDSTSDLDDMFIG
jgi:hypothetical protein